MGVNLPKDLQDFTAGVGLIDVGGISKAVSEDCCKSTQNGITASATETQAAGTVIRASIARVSTAGASDAVTLGIRAVAGTTFQLINDTGQTITLFPAVGDKINDAAQDAAVTIADNTMSIYSCPVAGLWFGGPLTFET